MLTILKLRSNKFPYSNLAELFPNKTEFISHINSNALFYSDSSFDLIKQKVISALYDKYAKRFPYEQDSSQLMANILVVFNTYFDTFLMDNVRNLGSNKTLEDFLELVKLGNLTKQRTKAGSSEGPYNIPFDAIEQLESRDYMESKRLSNTDYLTEKRDVLKLGLDFKQAGLNTALIDFLNSFSYLFASVDIDSYIEKNLTALIPAYKDVFTGIINKYNNIKPFLTWLKGING